MTIAARMDAAIRAVAPIVGVSLGRHTDKTTWRIDFAPGTTTEQRAAAAGVVASFDVSAAESAERARAAALGIIETRPGAYCNHTNTAGIAPWAAFMGYWPDRFLVFTGNQDWPDYTGSVGFIGGVWKDVPQPLLWSVPMFIVGGTLAEAAAGQYESHWTTTAQAIIARRGSEPSIAVRLAWEFNGNWYAYQAAGQEALFVTAFQRMVTAFRAVSPKFVVHWCVNLAGGFEAGYADVNRCWPGDGFVDVVTMDAYYDKAFDSPNPAAAFATKRNARWGLDWLAGFAAAHGKPFGIDEWGINQDLPAYVELFAAWMAEKGCAHQVYWHSANAFAGKLDLYPMAAWAYRRAFGVS
jgi:hypothetical protein